MTSALAPERFTPVDEALERLEDAVSPLVGIVTRTVSTTYTTDEASLPNCACELASGRRTLGAATVEYGSGAHESALPRPCRRDRRGDRAVLGDRSSPSTSSG